MSNAIILPYKGIVTIKFKIKDKIVSFENHNAGLPRLGKSFCKFITGNATTDEDIPYYLDIIKQVDGAADSSILINKIHLSGRYWEYSDPNYVAKFTAVVSYSSLKQSINRSDSGTFKLYMYSAGALSEALATMVITAESLSLISPGTQAIIEWSMMLDLGDDISIPDEALSL